jgi:hypothetical protein
MVVRVFHTTDAYVIYETADGQIQIDGDHGDFAQKAGIQLLLARFAEFRGDPVVRRKYTPKYAHAVRMAIDGNDAVAVTILEELMAEVPRHLNETRKAQLSYTLGSVVLVVFSLLLFWAAWRLDLLDPLGIRVFVALVFAAMGGGMSVAIGVKKLDLDIEESYFVNAFYGALRVAIAIVAGVVSLFLIESGFVFAFLRDSPSNSYAFALAAFLSGFSEMYVPNILKKLEDQSPTATPRTN